MNDILKEYSQEEIEQLAIQQLENNDLEDEAKIVKIDKEYKQHNKKAVMRAITNGFIIFVFVEIALHTDPSASKIDTDSIMNSIEKLYSAIPLINTDAILAVYAKMFDMMNNIIDKIGIFGMILSTKSIKFVVNTLGDTKKSIKMKKEIEELQKKIDERKNGNTR